MRRSSVFPLMLLASGILQAFPFVIGRPMEYSVIRRGGAERGIVTLLPVDSSQDPGGGSLWTFEVTDSLVAGKRRYGDTQAVLTTQIKLHVEDAYMAWTTRTCVVTWDLEEPQDNRIPEAGVWWGIWGFRALACYRGSGPDTGIWNETSTTSRHVVLSVLCETKSGCRNESSEVPLPQGQWSDDSGWIYHLDGETDESWILNRIGDGPKMPEGRIWLARKSRVVGRNDIWVFTKVVDWAKPKQPFVRPGDPTSGHDSTWIRWTVHSRLGDSGLIGTWRVVREMSGRQSGLDTFDIDFDSPMAYLETQNPKDLSLAVFLRAARPLAVSTSSFEWSRDGSRTNYGQERSREDMSLGRVYSNSPEGDFEKMEQTHHILVYNEGAGTLEEDSTIAISFRSFEPGPPTGVDSPMRPPRVGAPRSISDLERLVANGGQILSIRDIRGASVDLAARDDSKGKGKTPNVLVFQALSSEGILLQGRILSPAVR